MEVRILKRCQLYNGYVIDASLQRSGGFVWKPGFAGIRRATMSSLLICFAAGAQSIKKTRNVFGSASNSNVVVHRVPDTGLPDARYFQN